MQDRNSSEPTKGDRHFTRGSMLDNVEALVIAIILALVLRCFLVEAFAIPTGSMGPTLYGEHCALSCPNCGYQFAAGDKWRDHLCPNCGWSVNPGASFVWGGDRILVNKLLYRFEKPRRWDPFVFINPDINPRENPPKTTFIKRLIGLAGETLEIIRGDIIINGQIQRKTPEAQSSLWMPVYDSRWPWRDRNKPTWLPSGPDAPGWTETNGLLTVDAAGQDRIVSVSFAGHDGHKLIRDHYGYDPGQGLNVVTDVRLYLDVTPQSAGSLVLTLPEDANELTCVLPVEGSEGRTRLMLNKELLGETDVKLALGKVTRVEFSRVDYLITVAVAGKEVLRKDMWTRQVYQDLVRKGQDGTLNQHSVSGVRLGASRLKAELSHIRIDRDVYYETDPSQGPDGGTHNIKDYWFGRGSSPFGPQPVIAPGYIGPIKLNDDQYVAMGDNSPQSSDSRYWGPVPRENLIGKALVVWWYPTRLRLIH